MFIVTCTACGRTQEWTTGVAVGIEGKSKMELAGSEVYCDCGQSGLEHFTINCTNCGTHEHPSLYTPDNTSSIQVIGFTVFCTCGHIVTEEEGTLLREIQIHMRDSHTF